MHQETDPAWLGLDADERLRACPHPACVRNSLFANRQTALNHINNKHPNETDLDDLACTRAGIRRCPACIKWVRRVRHRCRGPRAAAANPQASRIEQDLPDIQLHRAPPNTLLTTTAPTNARTPVATGPQHARGFWEYDASDSGEDEQPQHGTAATPTSEGPPQTPILDGSDHEMQQLYSLLYRLDDPLTLPPDALHATPADRDTPHAPTPTLRSLDGDEALAQLETQPPQPDLGAAAPPQDHQQQPPVPSTQTQATTDQAEDPPTPPLATTGPGCMPKFLQLYDRYGLQGCCER